MDQLLKQFNFSDQEIIVYKTLLKLGGAKVSEIALTAKLKRTSCREYVLSLEEKGFVSSSKLGKKYFYQAEDPDKFRQIINERLFTLDRLATELKKEHRDIWEVAAMTLEEKRLLIKRAKKKSLAVLSFGDKAAGGAIINNKEILLFCGDKEMPALKIKSLDLARFHSELLRDTSLKIKAISLAEK